jgi:hypothetical protein
MSNIRDSLEGLMNDIDQEIDSIDNETVLNYDKRQFFKYVQLKIDKLTTRANILRFKYNSYKKYYDWSNIAIICIATSLTLFESVKSITELNKDTDKMLIKVMDIFPLFISSSITLIASILKFKKFQEKMENIIKCIERCIGTAYRITRIREKIRIVESNDALKKLKETFYGEPYEAYANCQEEIDKHLKYKDLIKHMKTYHALSLQNQELFANYSKKKQQLLAGDLEQGGGGGDGQGEDGGGDYEGVGNGGGGGEG